MAAEKACVLLRACEGGAFTQQLLDLPITSVAHPAQRGSSLLLAQL